MSSTTSQPALAPENPAASALAPVVTPGALDAARSGERHGLLALGKLDEAEFTQQLDTLKKGMERLDRIITEVLKEGLDADYAKLPGTDKKDLLLPGVEKLLFLTRLVPEYRLVRTPGTGEPGSPRIHYSCYCLLHLGDMSGPVVSSGVGTANSSEVKHRYRSSDQECPSCHKTGTLRRSKYPAKEGVAWAGQKGWYCFAKVGGCGAEFAPDDANVTFQQLGRVENPEPDDLDNTLAKMSKTRAVKDATKTALGGSRRFTQDVTENKTRVSPDDGRHVREAEATVVLTRSELEKELWAGAKARGMTKVGDLLEAMVQHGIISSATRNIKNVSDACIQRMLDAWRGEAQEGGDAAEPAEEPTQAGPDADIPF